WMEITQKSQTNSEKESLLPDETDNMDTNDIQTDQALGLETLVRHIEWHLTGRSFCIVFEDQVERYWPIKKMTDTERHTQIQAFAESHGWNAFMHKTDADRTRAIFIAQ